MAIDLIRLVGNAQTMDEVFKNLVNTEIMQSELDSSYIVLAARKEFAILEDADHQGKKFLHPYGSNAIYFTYNSDPDREA